MRLNKKILSVIAPLICMVPQLSAAAFSFGGQAMFETREEQFKKFEPVVTEFMAACSVNGELIPERERCMTSPKGERKCVDCVELRAKLGATLDEYMKYAGSLPKTEEETRKAFAKEGIPCGPESGAPLSAQGQNLTANSVTAAVEAQPVCGEKERSCINQKACAIFGVSLNPMNPCDRAKQTCRDAFMGQAVPFTFNAESYFKGGNAQVAEQGTSTAAQALSHSDPSLVAKGDEAYKAGVVMTFLEEMDKSLKQTVYCDEWSGSPNFSTCTKPLSSRACMNCRQETNSSCAFIGAIFGSPGKAFTAAAAMTGVTTAVVKAGGFGSKMLEKIVEYGVDPLRKKLMAYMPEAMEAVEKGAEKVGNFFGHMGEKMGAAGAKTAEVTAKMALKGYQKFSRGVEALAQSGAGKILLGWKDAALNTKTARIVIENTKDVSKSAFNAVMHLQEIDNQAAAQGAYAVQVAAAGKTGRAALRAAESAGSSTTVREAMTIDEMPDLKKAKAVAADSNIDPKSLSMRKDTDGQERLFYKNDQCAGGGVFLDFRGGVIPAGTH